MRFDFAFHSNSVCFTYSKYWFVLVGWVVMRILRFVHGLKFLTDLLGFFGSEFAHFGGHIFTDFQYVNIHQVDDFGNLAKRYTEQYFESNSAIHSCNIQWNGSLPLVASVDDLIWRMHIVAHVSYALTMDRQLIPIRRALCHRENMQRCPLLSLSRTKKIRLRPSKQQQMINERLKLHILCPINERLRWNINNFCWCLAHVNENKKITFFMLHFWRSLNGHDLKLFMRFFSRK